LPTWQFDSPEMGQISAATSAFESGAPITVRPAIGEFREFEPDKV